MKQPAGGTTNPVLLGQVSDRMDHPSWSEFFQSYDPLIRFWCGVYGFEGGALDDLCQDVWIELSSRVRTFQYDPGRSFRGWLRKLCCSRALDRLRKRRTDFAQPLDESLAAALSWAAEAVSDDDRGTATARRATLLCLGEQVQRAVKPRVDPRTWMIFRHVAVDGRSIREIADEEAMTYAAVFAAHKRVVRMLRAEGERRLADRSPDDLTSRPAGAS